MSADTPTDTVKTINKSEPHETGDSLLSILEQANTDDIHKSPANGRNKNRKKKRHHNNNKNNNKKWIKNYKLTICDLENLQNVKSSNNRKFLYGGQKHLKPVFKNILHRSYRCTPLPDTRLRKELIVPPTKFLLGGNISDPLNLNSLQDEALDTSENAATPKSSPITTPPKIEVIIPPNIFDPLHLLQPVDLVEYEELLSTPLKRKMKPRNRKRKLRKLLESSSSTIVSSDKTTSMNVSDTVEVCAKTNNDYNSFWDVDKLADIDRLPNIDPLNERERCLNDFRAELAYEKDGAVIPVRKRKNFECLNIHKKLRRMDSMDKIVSPVIPQPGTWKRLPPKASLGAPRNRNRVSSISTNDDIATISSTIAVQPTEDLAAGTTSTYTTHTPAMVSTSRIDNRPPQKIRPEKSEYQFGNHCPYMGFTALTENIDVRLKVFKQYQHLFQHKNVLDIGCHAGHVTIAIARMLNPKRVLGIDIDPTLISKAQNNLSVFVEIPKKNKFNDNIMSKRKNKRRYRTKANGYYPVSFNITYGAIPQQTEDEDEDQTTIPNPPSDVFPYNIQFKTMNYYETDEGATSDAQQYDLILCLSVTKYIHLNFGDAGLKSAFKRMFNQLRPGGKLILEAQNWGSYVKSKNLTQTTYNNYKSIEFFPNKFQEFLLSTDVGFSHTSILALLSHAKGFQRSLQLFAKGDFTPSQICWSDSYIPQTPYEEAYRAYYAQTKRPQTVRSSVWQSEAPHLSSRFTPLRGLAATSQYYNPLETDSYLPSYDNEIQTRHYCSVSPLYSTVCSPPSGRRSASHSPLFGSIRRVYDTDENIRPYVYLPTDNYDGHDSSRSTDDCSQSPRTSHVYAAATPESRGCREPSTEFCSPNSNRFAVASGNSSSPQQYSGESSRSVEIEQEDNVDDSLPDG